LGGGYGERGKKGVFPLHLIYQPKEGGIFFEKEPIRKNHNILKPDKKEVAPTPKHAARMKGERILQSRNPGRGLLQTRDAPGVKEISALEQTISRKRDGK